RFGLPEQPPAFGADGLLPALCEPGAEGDQHHAILAARPAEVVLWHRRHLVEQECRVVVGRDAAVDELALILAEFEHLRPEVRWRCRARAHELPHWHA